MKRKINENNTVYLLKQAFDTVSCMNYLYSEHKPLLNG